jgi:DNA-binding response OmpR family regulator
VAEKILVVEDEVMLAALVRDYLVQDGFEVSVLHGGDEVEPWVSTHEVDLVLLDLMLPGKNGLDVCKALRATSREVAIIMVHHPSRIYTREQLMDAMYRDERVVSDRTVDRHIKKIRRKISAVLPDREVVHSVYGLGYKYEW